MADWPISTSARGTWGAVQTGTSYFSWLQTGATPNTKTGWTQIVSSTIVGGSIVAAPNLSDSLVQYLFDLAIGGAGSEIPIIENMHGACPRSELYNTCWPFDSKIYVPSGTRLSFRAQSSAASKYCDMGINIVPVPTNSCKNLCRTYGADLSDSGGTVIDPGATINTKGSWTQVCSSTEFAFNGLIIGIGSRAENIRATCSWRIDVGLTSSPGNAVIVWDYLTRSRAESDEITPRFSSFLPIQIPKSTEIHVRAQCDINTTTYRQFDVVLYCFA